MFSRCAWLMLWVEKNKKCRNRIFFQAICSPCKTHRNDLLGKHIHDTQYTCCTLCYCRAYSPYTPVITDITFNPFCIVKNFPLFSRTISIIRSKWFVPHIDIVQCSPRLVRSNTDITWTQCVFTVFTNSFRKRFC